MSVSSAARDGRLVKCVVRHPETGRVIGLTSVELADQEWALNTDISKAPEKEQLKALGASPPAGDGVEPEALNPMARAKHWDAELKKQKYLEAAGELVPAAEVERGVVDAFAQCRARLLAIPSRFRQALPHLAPADALELEELIREALEDLALPDKAAPAPAPADAVELEPA